MTISHLADLTHDIHLNAGHADQPLEHLLSRIFAENLNKKTVIIVFSDHGIRFGPLRRTASGSFEERLPFVYIYVPEDQKIVGLEPWQVRKVLTSNSHQLTCHFDLHATMSHLLTGHVPRNEPFGRSWLTTINNRNCESAGITPDWCLCWDYVTLDANSSIGHQLGQVVIDNINKKLVGHTRCAKRNLVKIEQIKMGKSATTIYMKNKPKEKRLFMVKVRMSPGGGLVEATLQTFWKLLNTKDEQQHLEKPEAIEIVGEISRLDKYGPQAWCIRNAILEKYCYCK